jgi:hypothetical protein
MVSVVLGDVDPDHFGQYSCQFLGPLFLHKVPSSGQRLWFLLRNRIEKHFTGRAIDELEAEKFGTFAQGLELASAIEL